MTTPTTIAEAIRTQLEPAAQKAYPLEDAVAISTAISMKRIADFLAGSHDRSDIVDYAHTLFTRFGGN